MPTAVRCVEESSFCVEHAGRSKTARRKPGMDILNTPVPGLIARVNGQDLTNIFESASLVSLISALSKILKMKTRAMKRNVAPSLTAMPMVDAG